MEVKKQLQILQDSIKWMNENDLRYDAAYAYKYLGFLIRSWKESIDSQLLNLSQKQEELPTFNEKPIAAVEFYRLYPTVGHPNNVGEQVRKNLEKASYFIKREGNKYLVKPKSFLYYLYKYGSTRMRNRVTPILQNMRII